MRLINFEKYNSHTNPLFLESKILKISDYISRENCLLVHKFFSNSLSTAFEGYFDLSSSVHDHGTRSATLGLTSKLSYKTTFYGRLSIRSSAALSWNYFQSKLCHLKFIDLKYKSVKKESNDFILNSYTDA